jgi:hypothetical protein
VFWLAKISNSLEKGINNGSGLTWEGAKFKRSSPAKLHQCW